MLENENSQRLAVKYRIRLLDSLAEPLAQSAQVEPAILTPVGAVVMVVKAAVIEIEPVDVRIRVFW